MSPSLQLCKTLHQTNIVLILLSNHNLKKFQLQGAVLHVLVDEYCQDVQLEPMQSRQQHVSRMEQAGHRCLQFAQGVGGQDSLRGVEARLRCIQFVTSEFVFDSLNLWCGGAEGQSKNTGPRTQRQQQLQRRIPRQTRFEDQR